MVITSANSGAGRTTKRQLTSHQEKTKKIHLRLTSMSKAKFTSCYGNKECNKFLLAEWRHSTFSYQVSSLEHTILCIQLSSSGRRPFVVLFTKTSLLWQQSLCSSTHSQEPTRLYIDKWLANKKKIGKISWRYKLHIALQINRRSM
jgi:hypothetical protein